MPSLDLVSYFLTCKGPSLSTTTYFLLLPPPSWGKNPDIVLFYFRLTFGSKGLSFSILMLWLRSGLFYWLLAVLFTSLSFYSVFIVFKWFGKAYYFEFLDFFSLVFSLSADDATPLFIRLTPNPCNDGLVRISFNFVESLIIVLRLWCGLFIFFPK